MKIRNPDETPIGYKYQQQKETQYIFLIVFRLATQRERSAESFGPDWLDTEATDFNDFGLTLSKTMKYTSYILAFQLCVILGFSSYFCQATSIREIENLKEYFVSMTF